jgi:hypothetical protein
MKSVERMPRCAITAFLSLLALLVSAAGTSSQTLVSVPIKIDADQVVQFSVNITRHRYYYLDLAILFRNPDERIKARALVGEATPACRALNECGEESQFNVTISSADTVLMQQQHEAFGHYRATDRAYFRNILVTPLRPGRYQITVQFLKYGGQLRAVDAELSFGTDARFRDIGG